MGTTRRKPGSLGPYVEGYSAWLARRGYTALTARNMLKEFGQIGRWLAVKHVEVQQLSDEQLGRFLADQRRAGCRRLPGLRGLRVPLAYLREVGAVVSRPSPRTEIDVLLEQYWQWLVVERGLAPQTVLRYRKTGRRFLVDCAAAGVQPSALTGAEVNAFLIAECGRVSAGSAKGRVAELRSLLRFLFVVEVITVRLGTAVPPVGGWRLASVPPTMTPAEVQALLDQCHRSSDVGARNFAMLTLVARLGLRSIEVARLELGDLEWRAGESWCTARAIARTGCRCPPTSARPSWSICVAVTLRLAADRCSSSSKHPTARSGPNWSTTSPSRPASEPGCLESGRTGSVTLWPPSCSAGALA